MIMNSTIQGQLEIDHERGVIYFHANEPEWIGAHRLVTVLRICRLGKIPEEHGMIDITHMVGINTAKANCK